MNSINSTNCYLKCKNKYKNKIDYLLLFFVFTLISRLIEVLIRWNLSLWELKPVVLFVEATLVSVIKLLVEAGELMMEQQRPHLRGLQLLPAVVLRMFDFLPQLLETLALNTEVCIKVCLQWTNNSILTSRE